MSGAILSYLTLSQTQNQLKRAPKRPKTKNNCRPPNQVELVQMNHTDVVKKCICYLKTKLILKLKFSNIFLLLQNL